MVDSWDAVISALGKYQIESWRSGYVQAINESILVLDQKHMATAGDKTHNESGQCLACEVMQILVSKIKLDGE